MRLPSELVLDIAEFMDMRTMINYMLTNKTIYAIVKGHERSITKKRAKDFLLPTTGAVLSSRGPDRHVLAAGSFRSILEFELRDRRIDHLLRGSFVDRAGPAGSEPLTVRQQDRFAELLKRGLCQCDRMADAAADAAADDPGGRVAQIDYIRSLPVRDIVPVHLMISIASHRWLRAKPHLSEDPNLWETLTVFEECLLRHGSWFLWSQLAAEEAMREASGHLLRTGLRELMDWETGKADMKPGLRMTLLETAKGGLERGDHVVVATELFTIARAMIEA